jgi:hypothetical protein
MSAHSNPSPPPHCIAVRARVGLPSHHRSGRIPHEPPGPHRTYAQGALAGASGRSTTRALRERGAGGLTPSVDGRITDNVRAISTTRRRTTTRPCNVSPFVPQPDVRFAARWRPFEVRRIACDAHESPLDSTRQAISRIPSRDRRAHAVTRRLRRCIAAASWNRSPSVGLSAEAPPTGRRATSGRQGAGPRCRACPCRCRAANRATRGVP